MSFSNGRYGVRVFGVCALGLLGSAGCSSALDPTRADQTIVSNTADTERLAELVTRTRAADLTVELVVEVEVEGVSEARIASRGRIEQGGERFDLEIVGPAPFGSAADHGPVEVRLVDHRLFQRGPIVAELFPEAGDRWVETTRPGSTATALGLIGPAGFAALDLLDDPDDVRSPIAGRFEGVLRDVRFDGASVAHVAESEFEVEERDGLIGSMRVRLRSANGVELGIDLLLDRRADEVLRPPNPEDVYTP